MATTKNTTTYTLAATIAADGSLQIAGLTDGVLEVSASESVSVEIKDAPDYYVYADEIPLRGQTPACWVRGQDSVVRDFGKMRDEVVNVVYAASTANNANIKYGPVIKVKPKG